MPDKSIELGELYEPVGLLLPPLNCSVNALTAVVSSSSSDAMLFPDNVGI